MMYWLWINWMSYLFCLLGLSTSAEASQVIIRRGYFDLPYTEDFFSYTNDSTCGDAGDVHRWCNLKDSYELSDSPVSFRCSCVCDFSHKTFFPLERKCVDDSYLQNTDNFGDGEYKFNLEADFNQSNSVNIFDMQDYCKKCSIANIIYFENDQWKAFSFKSLSINKDCVLSWKRDKSGVLAGKIVKILLRDCEDLSNQIFFLKAKGEYSIDLTTPILSTVVATISSSMDSTEMPTFTSSSTPTVTPTPALKTSTHQVPEFVRTPQASPTRTFMVPSHVCSSGDICPSSSSEFVRIPQMSPTRTFMVSSHVCNSGDICPSSSSVAVLLHTTAIQAPTNRTLGYQSSLGSSTWAIIAAVVACILVGGIVALFVVLRRRRRDNSRARFSKDPAKVSTKDTDNPMYGHNRGDVISLPNRQSGHTQKHEDEEYDYATVDGVRSDHQKPSTPIYQSLIKDNVGSSVYDPLNKVATTPMGYSYNHLQHPRYNPPRSRSDPLYNTLEIPGDDEYLEPETQIIDNPTGVSEPVYNVLEGPDANSAPHDDVPVYNILEDPNPNQDNDPVYNVLEGPDDDYDNAPIDDDQNIPISGQDNVAYSSTIDFNIPHSPSSPDFDVLEGPEGALPDSTYQPLSIRVQDDVYQPLDRASQSIYQTLEPRDSSA